jgi:hypothetical protein
MADLTWDTRLITRGQAFEIVGERAVVIGFRATADGNWMVFLDCHECGRPVAELCLTDMSTGTPIEHPYPVTVDAIVSGVLRHRVIHHEEVLSGARGERSERGDHPDAATVDRPGDPGSAGVPRSVLPGPGDQEPAPGGSEGPGEEDR